MYIEAAQLLARKMNEKKKIIEEKNVFHKSEGENKRWR